MSRLRVLLFDVFGTLVDWRSSVIETGEAIAGRSKVSADWAAVADDWRREYQPALDRIRHGRREGTAWRDLDSLQRETLAGVLGRHAVDLPAADRETLVGAWRRLRPWPDSREGLGLLRREHVTATLSNGHVALLVDLLKFADLRVDAVLSSELAASYKPDPEVYLTALRLLGCRPEDAGMVAAHAADLRAAAALGLRPIFVRRPFEWGPDAAPADPPALEGVVAVEGLVSLAETLGE